MKLSELAEGIAILRPYYDREDGYHVGAEHDEIFLFATDRPVSPEDVKKLLELGWFQGEGATDEAPEDYSQEEGWTHFT